MADTRTRIVDAACAQIEDTGLADLTVGDVASRAEVSTALVHYHFATKDRLVEAACGRLAAQRSNARIRALTGSRGLAALDAAWSLLSRAASAGVERTWHDMALRARHDAEVRRVLAEQREGEHAALAAKLPTLLADLGATPAIPADEAARAVLLLLDGASLAIAEGVAAGEVKAAYDAFWLVLVTAGQARAR